jgi:hypothetical protein
MSKKHEDLMLTWLENTRLENVQAYVSRGRLFSSLSLDQLKSQWAAAFKSYVADPSAPGARVESDDLEAELMIRREELPMELVQVEWQHLLKNADLAIERLKRDPKRLKEANEEIVKDVADFYEAADKREKN